MSVISIGKELTIVGALPPCPPPLPPFLHKVTSHVHPGSPGRLWVPLPLPPRKIPLTSHFEPSLSAPQRHPLLAQEPQPDLSSTTFLTPPNPHASCPIKRNALTSQPQGGRSIGPPLSWRSWHDSGINGLLKFDHPLSWLSACGEKICKICREQKESRPTEVFPAGVDMGPGKALKNPCDRIWDTGSSSNAFPRFPPRVEIGPSHLPRESLSRASVSTASTANTRCRRRPGCRDDSGSTTAVRVRQPVVVVVEARVSHRRRALRVAEDVAPSRSAHRHGARTVA
jgi:hypothetical protein